VQQPALAYWANVASRKSLLHAAAGALAPPAAALLPRPRLPCRAPCAAAQELAQSMAQQRFTLSPLLCPDRRSGAAVGRRDLVKLLISAALCHAAAHCRSEEEGRAAVRALLDRATTHGLTALMVACRRGCAPRACAACAPARLPPRQAVPALPARRAWHPCLRQPRLARACNPTYSAVDQHAGNRGRNDARLEEQV